MRDRVRREGRQAPDVLEKGRSLEVASAPDQKEHHWALECRCSRGVSEPSSHSSWRLGQLNKGSQEHTATLVLHVQNQCRDTVEQQVCHADSLLGQARVLSIMSKTPHWPFLF